MIPDPQDEPTLTVERAGRILGLGRSAAYEAARRGELPIINFGRRVLVPTAALRRLLQLDDPDATEAPAPGASVINAPTVPGQGPHGLRTG